MLSYEKIKKAIEVLTINLGCVELDKSNGIITKHTDDFIEACSIAINILELYNEGEIK